MWLGQAVDYLNISHSSRSRAQKKNRKQNKKLLFKSLKAFSEAAERVCEEFRKGVAAKKFAFYFRVVGAICAKVSGKQCVFLIAPRRSSLSAIKERADVTLGEQMGRVFFEPRGSTNCANRWQAVCGDRQHGAVTPTETAATGGLVASNIPNNSSEFHVLNFSAKELKGFVFFLCVFFYCQKKKKSAAASHQNFHLCLNISNPTGPNLTV